MVVDGIDGGRHHVGPGHYETLVEVGRFEGVPMLTFTAPHGLDHVEHNEPSPAYLAMLADGLRESRQWNDEDIAAYFDRVVPSSLALDVLLDAQHLSRRTACRSQ